MSAEETYRVCVRKNTCRRDVPAGEKSEMLGNLGEMYLSEGLKLGKIAYKIAEETGMSYWWVMKYLPDKLEERPGVGGEGLPKH